MMKGKGASSTDRKLSLEAGSTGMIKCCQAKGRMRVVSARTAVVSSPMLGQKTTVRSSNRTPAGTLAFRCKTRHVSSPMVGQGCHLLLGSGGHLIGHRQAVDQVIRGLRGTRRG